MSQQQRRLPRGAEIVLASHNEGKLRECVALLAASDIVVRSAAELGLPEPDETAETFEGNAVLKAKAAAQATGLPALADDSGFCVAALGGRPGVYSARWAGPERDMTHAMNTVRHEMEKVGLSNEAASFRTVLCLAWPDGVTRCVEGICHGRVVWPPRGQHGHGYDPMFVPDGESRTFAEMTDEAKNRFSHRAKAMAQFLKECVA